MIFQYGLLCQMENNGTMYISVLILIALFILLFFHTLNQQRKKKMDEEFKKEQLERDRLYYEAYDDLVNLIRERQHDLKNHISAILGMVYTVDNYEELVKRQKEYCKAMIDKNKETKLLLSVGSPLVTGFLYRKIEEAEALGITVDFKVDMPEAGFVVPDYEVVEILGILLDNAVEALGGEEAPIKKIYVALGNCHIAVANSGSTVGADEVERFFSRGFSTKGRGRGVGLAKLKKIASGAGGEIVVSNEDCGGINFLQFKINFLQK